MADSVGPSALKDAVDNDDGECELIACVIRGEERETRKARLDQLPGEIL